LNTRFFKILTPLVFLLSAVCVWRLIVSTQDAESTQHEGAAQHTWIITPEKPASETAEAHAAGLDPETILVMLNPSEHRNNELNN
jgi:hypothetical protein